MLCFYHHAKEHDMLLWQCVVAFLTGNREKQAVGANEYLTVQQLCGCTLHSLDPTIRCGEQRRGERKMRKTRRVLQKILLYTKTYHTLQKCEQYFLASVNEISLIESLY